MASPVSGEGLWAAQALDARMPGQRSMLIGGAVSVYAERHVDGDLSSVSTSAIVSVIRRRMRRSGALTEVGGLLEWRSKGELGERSITLSSREGDTAITRSGDLRNAAAVTFFPAAIVGALASAIGFVQAAAGANPVAVVLALLLVPAIFLASRFVFGRVSRAEAARLERALGELSQLVRESGDGEDTESEG